MRRITTDHIQDGRPVRFILYYIILYYIILYYIILYYIILYYIILYYIILYIIPYHIISYHIIYYIIIVLQLPTVFSTVTYCTGLLSRSNRLYHIA